MRTLVYVAGLLVLVWICDQRLNRGRYGDALEHTITDQGHKIAQLVRNYFGK
jgi:hypothetical protein